MRTDGGRERRERERGRKRALTIHIYSHETKVSTPFRFIFNLRPTLLQQLPELRARKYVDVLAVLTMGVT